MYGWSCEGNYCPFAVSDTYVNQNRCRGGGGTSLHNYWVMAIRGATSIGALPIIHSQRERERQRQRHILVCRWSRLRDSAAGGWAPSLAEAFFCSRAPIPSFLPSFLSSFLFFFFPFFLPDLRSLLVADEPSIHLELRHMADGDETSNSQAQDRHAEGVARCEWPFFCIA